VTTGDTFSGATYVWKKKYANSDNWQLLSNTTSSYSIADANPVKGSFDIKCEVSYPGTGRTGSAIYRIDIIGYN
jgi:hypothetical protein